MTTTTTTTATSTTAATTQGGSDGCGTSSGVNNGSTAHRKGHRRQESMYAMTGLYSETANDDSSIDAPQDSELHNNCVNQENLISDTIIKCHSRQPSSSLVDRDKSQHVLVTQHVDEFSTNDCGILNCRPKSIQNFARIKIFVLLLSILVTLQQALSSGYINSVITTIEKRFEIPSSLSGLIASSYEIGNVITVIFVSYLGSRRHIPVWIGIGAVIMGIGSLVFMVPHFTGEPNPGISLENITSDNICRGVSVREQDMGLGRLSSGISNQPLHNNLRGDNCIQSKSSTFGPVLLFVIAQLLLGCGGSPLFTLGTTYVDDHVRAESSSMYIGCMYSMAAFGPVMGFLLGAYLLSFHMDSFTSAIISIDPGDRRWVGMWWGGFLLCGLLLIIVAIPFFSFPKVLTREKKKIRNLDKKPIIITGQPNNSNSLPRPSASSIVVDPQKQNLQESKKDTGYGKDIKDIPSSMWRLVSNPVYITTCLGACMELMIVSGFVVFLPKYLETQFSLGKSQASIFTGSIAVPGACIGIFVGGCILKKFELKPKGAVQFVLISNLVCLACYGLLFFLGCDNLKMAGTTIPYYNSSTHLSEPFQVNLTAACNFGCKCNMLDVEPVCGNNGLTYFSPCHAGCTAFSSRSNYTNCACVHSNVTNTYTGGDGSIAQASIAREDFAEVTVVPVATAGPCSTPCRTIYPFLILLFFMTFIVASTQMPLLMIVLRSVSEEERAFALGMQFVIFRLFGYIPAPIVFGNLIDSTCILWQSTCGEKGGRCLIYDIVKFRYKYVGLCASIKIVALLIFIVDWWLVRRRKHMEYAKPISTNDVVGSILSLDKLFEEKEHLENQDISEVITDDFGNSNKKIIVASRHLRNESKTIQLEYRNDDTMNSGNNLNIHRKPPAPRKQHFRSNSCDTKIIRTNSKEYENDFKLNKFPLNRGHSRNNSRDMNEDFRTKLTHSRNNSRDDQQQTSNLNIKFIINQLKSAVKETDQLNRLKSGESFRFNKHKRNNSYDYNSPPSSSSLTSAAAIASPASSSSSTSYCLPKNQKSQQSRMSLKDDINLLKNINHNTNKFTHSRNNSKDLNIDPNDIQVTSTLVGPNATPSIIIPDAIEGTSASSLRHRRTNSKDLKNHTRNLSQNKIQIDNNISSSEATQLLLIKTNSQENLNNESDLGPNV